VAELHSLNLQRAPGRQSVMSLEDTGCIRNLPGRNQDFYRHLEGVECVPILLEQRVSGHR
jgi:hypothetical protein